MAHNVHIRETATGETRTYRDDEPWDELIEFLWSEGNRACDCNRGHAFAALNNNDRSDVACGASAYVIRVTDDAGRELYADAKWADGDRFRA